MPEAIENYISQTAVASMRRRSFFVWGASAALIAAWILLIFLAPFTASNNLENISSSIYKFFSFLCHQMPERSFSFRNQAFAVCSRCFGVYAGLFFGCIVYPLLRSIEETEPLPRFWLLLALVPMAIDWALGVFGIWENTSFSRLISGLILGAACAVFIVPALIEIASNLPVKAKVKRLSI